MLYTVVTLAILGGVLALALPKMQQGQERALIGQQVAALKSIDATVHDVFALSPGNTKIYRLSLERGTFVVDGMANTISMTIPDVGIQYSDVGVPIQDGDVSIETTVAGKKRYLVTARTSYDALGINITTRDRDRRLELSAAPTPYALEIRHGQGSKTEMVNGVVQQIVTHHISLDQA